MQNQQLDKLLQRMHELPRFRAAAKQPTPKIQLNSSVDARGAEKSPQTEIQRMWNLWPVPVVPGRRAFAGHDVSIHHASIFLH
jgi:hypothetical protein